MQFITYMALLGVSNAQQAFEAQSHAQRQDLLARQGDLFKELGQVENSLAILNNYNVPQ